MTLGEKLRKLRKESDMTLDDLSKLSGLSTPYLSYMEREVVNPTIVSIAKVARVYGMPLSVLFYKVKINLEED